MAKLQLLNFPPGFIVWLNSYLQNRNQYVRINGVRSDYLRVTSGAPQGSLLGPYLFLLMCVDFGPRVSSTFLIQYADDATEVCPIFDHVNPSENVHAELDNIVSWSRRNGFSLNSSKTQCMVIWKKGKERSLDLPFDVHDSIKILGVVWHKSLSWDFHFDIIESRCSRLLYLIRILKGFVKHDDLWSIYDSMIESLLLFSVELFGDFSQHMHGIVNRVFKRCKRIICSNQCTHVNKFFVKRLGRISGLLLRAQDSDHPLYSVVPHRRVVSGRFILPTVITTRRRNCFPVYSVILHNDVILG